MRRTHAPRPPARRHAAGTPPIRFRLRARRRVPFIVALALVIAAFPAAAQDSAERPTILVIDDVTVVDVAAGRLVPGQRIVIRGDTIAAVEPMTAPAPAERDVSVNGAGLFAIPGLVDHHVHLSAGSGEALERAARGGVTLVQAMAGDNRTAGELARAVLAGELAGPEIAYASVMAGPAFFEDPRFRGAGLGYPPGAAPWAQAVTADTDPVTAVAAARGSGAEVIKLYAMLEPDVVEALTREAHRQGLRVVAHGTVFPTRPTELVDAGVDILTHAPYLSWEGAGRVRPEDAWNRAEGPYADVPVEGAAMTAVIRAMARRGTYLEPTLRVFERREDPVLQGWAVALTRATDASGVPILAGTDDLIDRDPRALPNIHGELAALVAAGLSPARALAAATVVPARAMGRAATHGVVAAGRVADLVLLTADPLADIGATTRIRWVVRRGTLVEPRGR